MADEVADQLEISNQTGLNVRWGCLLMLPQDAVNKVHAHGSGNEPPALGQACCEAQGSAKGARKAGCRHETSRSVLTNEVIAMDRI